MKNEPPAPPSSEGMSIPMSPSSANLGISSRSYSPACSMLALRGAISAWAKSRTAERNISSSSDRTVSGAGAAADVDVISAPEVRGD